MEASKVADVALPRSVVTLTHLKTKNGQGLSVICEPAEEAAVLMHMRALPGLTIKTLLDEARESELGELPGKTVAEAMPFVASCLEVGCKLVGEGGREVQAFWFTDEVPGAIPGRYLRAQDWSALFLEVMKLSGYGGAADSLGFPDGRARRADGVGTGGSGAAAGTGAERAADAPEASAGADAGAGDRRDGDAGGA